jgi:hypothetical protein
MKPLRLMKEYERRRTRQDTREPGDRDMRTGVKRMEFPTAAANA